MRKGVVQWVGKSSVPPSCPECALGAAALFGPVLSVCPVALPTPNALVYGGPRWAGLRPVWLPALRMGQCRTCPAKLCSNNNIMLNPRT